MMGKMMLFFVRPLSVVVMTSIIIYLLKCRGKNMVLKFKVLLVYDLPIHSYTTNAKESLSSFHCHIAAPILMKFVIKTL